MQHWTTTEQHLAHRKPRWMVPCNLQQRPLRTIILGSSSVSEKTTQMTLRAIYVREQMSRQHRLHLHHQRTICLWRWTSPTSRRWMTGRWGHLRKALPRMANCLCERVVSPVQCSLRHHRPTALVRARATAAVTCDRYKSNMLTRVWVASYYYISLIDDVVTITYPSASIECQSNSGA